MRRKLSDDLAYLFVVEHGDADDVGGGDVGDAVGEPGAHLGQRRHRIGTHVEHRQAARPVDQPLGDRPAHLPKADEAELDVTCTHGSSSPQDRKICPPSTLKICPVIHLA